MTQTQEAERHTTCGNSYPFTQKTSRSSSQIKRHKIRQKGPRNQATNNPNQSNGRAETRVRKAHQSKEMEKRVMHTPMSVVGPSLTCAEVDRERQATVDGWVPLLPQVLSSLVYPSVCPFVRVAAGRGGVVGLWVLLACCCCKNRRCCNASAPVCACCRACSAATAPQFYPCQQLRLLACAARQAFECEQHRVSPMQVG